MKVINLRHRLLDAFFVSFSSLLSHSRRDIAEVDNPVARGNYTGKVDRVMRPPCPVGYLLLLGRNLLSYGTPDKSYPLTPFQYLATV